MIIGKDFVYITQKNNIIFMWLDEPIETSSGWVGKIPYLNSVVYKKVLRAIGNTRLTEPEIIVLQ